MTESEKKQYMISSAIAGTKSYYPDNVSFYENSKATPLIDGNEYFKDLVSEIKKLESGDAALQGIYISAWAMSSTLKLDWTNDDGTTTQKTMLTILKEQAARGVDVRLLLWVSDYLFDTSVHIIPTTILAVGGDVDTETSGGFAMETCKENLNVIQQLRSDLFFENKIQANTLDVEWGSVHAKMVVVYSKESAVAYTGGIDLMDDRKTDYGHDWTGWHDVQIRSEGDIVKPLYEHFRYMWNELVKRKDKYWEYVEAFEDMDGGIERPELEEPYPVPVFLFKGEEITGTTDFAEEIASLPSTVNLTIPVNQNIMQSVRTVPIVGNDEPFTGAENGIFEIGLAIQKLIASAKSYLYIEDQFLYSRDILAYIVAALQDTSRPELVVILITTNGNYFTNDFHPLALEQFLYSQINTEQLERIKVFYHQGVTIVHSKLYIADDICYIAGSANCGNRSLYTDFEHAVIVTDKNGFDSVKNLRIRLWAEHFRITAAEKSQIEDINAALNVWYPTWRTSASYSYTRAAFKLPQWATSATELSSDTQAMTTEKTIGSALRIEEIIVHDAGVLKPSFKDTSGCWLLLVPVDGSKEKLVRYTASYGTTLDLRMIDLSDTDWDKYNYVLLRPNIVTFTPKTSIIGFYNPGVSYKFYHVLDPGELPAD